MSDLEAGWPLRYRAEDTIDYSWIDLREARPRQRAKLKSGIEVPAEVFINEDGTLDFDPTKIEIGQYEGPEYEAVRAESAAYWAKRDEQNSEG